MYELRNKKNISQEDLAEVLDVSRQSISKWENDKAYPEMTRLLFMSDYFDVSFMLLYILIICALVSFVVSVIYCGGYEIGKFIGYLME